MALTAAQRRQQHALAAQRMKWCQQCDRVKSFEEFFWNRERNAPRAYCKSCHKTYAQLPATRARRRAAQYHRQPHRKSDNRFRTTGFTQTLWDAAWSMQNGRCAICHCDLLLYHNPHVPKGAKMCADHDHTTRTPRGILCSGCNKALGFFKDSIARLQAAINYLSDPPLSVLL